jgi:hypothetical protein
MHRHEVEIPAPCQRSWAAMPGDDRRRHCDACDHAVVALSALTLAEARTLLATPVAGHRCVRFEHDAAGRVQFADTPRPGDRPEPPRPIMGRIASRPRPPPPPPVDPPEPLPVDPPA